MSDQVTVKAELQFVDNAFVGIKLSSTTPKGRAALRDISYGRITGLPYCEKAIITAHASGGTNAEYWLRIEPIPETKA